MWFRIIFLFFFIFLASMPVVAQDSEKSGEYVQTFPNRFHLKLATQYEPMVLRIGNANSDKQLIYRHNSRPQVGIGAIITGVHLIASVKLPESFSESEEAYGTPRFHNFQLNVNGEKVLVNFEYQFRDGFYLSDTENLPALSSSDPFLLEDLSLERYLLNVIYVFNADRFSYRAIITQHDAQQKSGGSFFLQSGIKYFRVWGDGNLLPSEYRAGFEGPSHLYHGEFSGLTVMPGYSHTFTLHDFYLNLGLAAGPELQYKDYRTGEQTQYDYWKLEPIVNLRGGFGYDNGNFFTGLYYLNRRDHYQAGELDINYQSNFFRVVLGHRFQQPGWMQGIRETGVYQWVDNLF